jgi:parvulin-like peptidyl-prolyl isomerase
MPSRTTATRTFISCVSRSKAYAGVSWCSCICLAAALAAFSPALQAQDYSGGMGQGYTPMAPSTVSSSSAMSAMKGSIVPGTPVAPSSGMRPTSWPTGGAAPQNVPNQQSIEPISEMQPCAGTRILARVGSEAIFESEVAGSVNQIIEANKSRIPPSQIDAQRELLIQQRLKGVIETKLVFQDAKKTIPTEGWNSVEKQLTKHFEDTELERLKKNAGVETNRELDQRFRSFGTSLEREKRSFIEQMLAKEWVRQHVKPDEEVTYNQMVSYYRDHQEDFTSPARVKYEELMVRFSKHPTKDAAFQAIARMGNQVFGGVPFAQVAQNGSDGVTANQGGQFDWTSKGSLANQVVDTALFTLPVGQMSPILEGPKGYHIIRVTCRENEEVRPFLEAQVDIKKKIIEQRSQKGFKEYMVKLREKTPVWTIYDGKDGNLHLASQPQSPIR